MADRRKIASAQTSTGIMGETTPARLGDFTGTAHVMDRSRIYQGKKAGPDGSPVHMAVQGKFALNARPAAAPLA
jgi:hypothetical protein